MKFVGVELAVGVGVLVAVGVAVLVGLPIATLNERVAGVWSVLPAASVASTENV